MVNLNVIVYALIGLALLFLIIKLLKWPLKILINGILGIVLLYITNIIGNYMGFILPINAVSALIAGFLGIPGIILLILFQFFV
ncbi:MAG: pro-sigmaK processing inhibitor BofA family protein [Clostridium sp.]|nr:pro-sigmaK processing inhibitor BofA family protein [Clostridium sp.]